MKQPTPVRSSLARATLFKIGVRIAVIIALSTFFSYLHMLQTLRAEALVQLAQYVTERSQREQAIFLLAEDNHALLKRAMEERILALRHEDVRARFDSLFVTGPDGAVRNRPEGFDGTKGVGVFIPRGVTVDEDLRRRLLAAYDVLLQYGPAFRTRFTDTFITLPEGAVASYWPESPNYCLEISPTEMLTSLEYFSLFLGRRMIRSDERSGPASIWSLSARAGCPLPPRRWTWTGAMSRQSAMTSSSRSW